MNCSKQDDARIVNNIPRKTIFVLNYVPATFLIETFLYLFELSDIGRYHLWLFEYFTGEYKICQEK